MKQALLDKYSDMLQQIKDILEKNPDALKFVLAYGEYIEMVDDIVDEPKDVELVDRCTALATDLFSSNYWLQNSRSLILVERVIHMTYFNVVKWEKSEEAWKRRDAKAMSHVGYMMLFAILLLETGDSQLVQSIAIQFMEKAHLEHISDLTPEEQLA